MQRVFSIFILLLTTSTLSFSQSSSSDISFRSPVDFPMRLSGTFGELRSGHFHSGIDIKTYEQTGKVVRAISDGYISRIKITSGSYGKALYVTHNNGYTSVFAHLKTFNRTINKYVRRLQLKKRSYEIDVSVPKYRLYYKKGDIIAYTGNSGYSMGPHLHFEIRETATQKPVNPLYFGFDIKDDIAPKIYSIKIYENESKYGFASEKIYDLQNKNGEYFLKVNSDTIDINGKVSFGIRAIDKLNNTPNPDGVYRIRLKKQDTVVFSWHADQFSFYETRYINSLIDYNEYQKSKNKFVRTKLDEYNRLSMYEMVKENGQFFIPKDSVVQFTYQVSDYHGNTSEVDFYIRQTCDHRDTTLQPEILGKDSILLDPSQKHNLLMEDLQIEFPAMSFYRETLLHVEKSLPDSAQPFPVYSIGNKGEPVHKYFTIKADRFNVADSLLDRAVWGRYDKEGDFEWIKSERTGSFLKGITRNFGVYSIKIDTIPPEIDFLNIKEARKINGNEQNTIRIEVKDKLTGIDEYEIFLNGKWVIAEYDAKNDELIYRFDKFLKKGENKIKVRVTDNKGNENIRQLSFEYTN